MTRALGPFALSTLLLSASFACGDARGIATGDDEIRDGKVETGNPAVGLLVFENSAICTGTLIAPDVVLTAGHCVDEGKIPVAFYTGVGKAVAKISSGEATAGMTKHEVTAGEFVPGYVVTKKCPKEGLDVGLVKLAAPADGIAPAPIDPRAPDAGETCVAVGFGKSPLADGTATRGEKKSAEVTFRTELHGSFAFDDTTGGTEKGDSGGPLFCKDAVVAVNSCGNRPDRFARVDVAMPWIRARVADWNAPWTGGEIGALGPLPSGAGDDPSE